ncbi:hypothetical protein [Flavobacterium sp.]|uniref:hypothetical protein n=1 Tax=Flavobacterium sp. TaxID=239 RepID=UPI0039E6A3DE
MKMTTQKMATISFVAFLIVLLKYLLINELGFIPPYSLTHRAISWFVILPVLIIGCSCSVVVLIRGMQSIQTHRTAILLSIPLLALTVYYLS